MRLQGPKEYERLAVRYSIPLPANAAGFGVK